MIDSFLIYDSTKAYTILLPLPLKKQTIVFILYYSVSGALYWMKVLLHVNKLTNSDSDDDDKSEIKY